VKKRRLLDEMHETARGLERIGALDKQTMREFDTLALPPVRELSAKQIRALRTRTRVSQAVFAAMVNTSVFHCSEVGDRREATEWPIVETRL
jgi:putative transcriptional regulator